MPIPSITSWLGRETKQGSNQGLVIAQMLKKLAHMADNRHFFPKQKALGLLRYG